MKKFGIYFLSMLLMFFLSFGFLNEFSGKIFILSLMMSLFGGLIFVFLDKIKL